LVMLNKAVALQRMTCSGCPASTRLKNHDAISDATTHFHPTTAARGKYR
jgi:hypothetical protein